jgi:hypothetical protein
MKGELSFIDSFPSTVLRILTYKSSLPNLNDEHAEFWKSSSGDIRNEIYVKCALALEGEMVEEANHQSFTSHARVSGIFSRIIVSILFRCINQA